MPPTPKSSPKKSGAPKAKGAIRAKSGCYTCRIRRKKCDEQTNEDGQCGTCVRLRLECLGFGAKRPDYLKESGNVAEMRTKIKGFLASQGMIKGHSGSGPRSNEQEPVVLRLAEDCSYSSESSGSPQTPTLAIPDDSHVLTMSSMRDEGRQQWLSYDTHSAVHHPQDQELSPIYSSTAMFGGDMMLPTMTLTSSPSDSILSSSSTWPPEFFDPSRMSHLARSYNNTYDEDSPPVVDVPLPVSIPINLQTRPRDVLLSHYINDVVGLQYLLVGKSIPDLMFQTARMDPIAGDAMCWLSATYQNCMTPAYLPSPHSKERMELLTASVSRILHKRNLSAEDAIAALHTVSTSLFVGGLRQEWTDWLRVAYIFCDSLIRQPFQFVSTAEIVSRFDDKLRFIVKTAMWFDVIASVTLMQPPHFMQEYRELFHPLNGYVEGSLSSHMYPPLRMLTVMGCENHVVWAMAAVSDLACWKENQQREGRLSMSALAKRAWEIEPCVLPRAGPYRPCTKTQIARFLTSEIFRASTRVYLHSVLSGDFPQCPEIMDGIDDTVKCLRNIDNYPEHKRSVVRSVVLSIFICGCLTDDLGYREYLSSLLKGEEAETVGNSYAVRGVMEDVWKLREPGSLQTPVQWRQPLREAGLLLV